MSSEDGKKSGGAITTLHLQCRCSLGKGKQQDMELKQHPLTAPPPPRAVCVCVWLFMPPERIVGMNWIRIRWGRWGKESGWSRLFRLGFIDSLSFTSYLIHSTLGERQWIECVFLCVREKNNEWVCISFSLNDSRSKWPCYWNQRPSFGGKSASCRNSAI